jgi:hypothetical protein
MADKTGETWRGAVDKYNCWEDLILTLGMFIARRGIVGVAAMLSSAWRIYTAP